MKSINKNLAHWVFIERTKSGLTRSEVAERLGINESLLGAYEHGTAAIPLCDLDQLLLIYDISVIESTQIIELLLSCSSL